VKHLFCTLSEVKGLESPFFRARIHDEEAWTVYFSITFDLRCAWIHFFQGRVDGLGVGSSHFPAPVDERETRKDSRPIARRVQASLPQPVRKISHSRPPCHRSQCNKSHSRFPCHRSAYGKPYSRRPCHRSQRNKLHSRRPCHRSQDKKKTTRTKGHQLLSTSRSTMPSPTHFRLYLPPSKFP